jgi:hypothetical protein
VRESQPPPPESEDYPPQSEDFWDEAMEAEWWRRRIRDARQARQLRERRGAFIGPRMPQLSRSVRANEPRPPREDGMAYMRSGYNLMVDCMMIGGALPPDYVDGMSKHLGDIAAIVNETVVDDEKAGLLMRTIGYTLDYMANLGRIEGEYGPSYVLRYDAALRKNGADNSGKVRAVKADARWRRAGEKMWREVYADLTPDDPNRITVEDLATAIQDEVAGSVKLGTVLKQIGAWNKRDGVKKNEKRRR